MISIEVSSEADIQLAVCDYLRAKYPLIIFNSDGAGNNVSHATAARNTLLRSSNGYPDLFIAQPRGRYHGLFLELKRDDATVFLKDGSLSSSERIVRQHAMLQALQDRGYAADFACGYDEAVEKIDIYMRY